MRRKRVFPGRTHIHRQTSNSSGASPKTNAKAYIGFGIPSAPATVRAQWADGTASRQLGRGNDGDGRRIRKSFGHHLYPNEGQTGQPQVKTQRPRLSPSLCPYRPNRPHTPYGNGSQRRPQIESRSQQHDSPGHNNTTVRVGFLRREQTLKGYTIIDASKDGRTWTWDAEGRCPRILQHRPPDPDGRWLITPGWTSRPATSTTCHLTHT